MKKILQLLSSVPSYDSIRVIEPLRRINESLKARNCVVTLLPLHKIDQDIARQFDVVCIHGTVSLAVYAALQGCKLCLFVDDLMTHIPASNPASPTAQELEALQWCYSSAHARVCTTRFLADHIRTTYGAESFTCPNLMDMDEMLNKSEHVLYSFGNSHAGDLEMLNELDTQRQIFFFGHTLPSGMSHYYRTPVGNVELYPNQPNVHLVPLQQDYERYLNWMNQLDYGVGLVPMRNDIFNASKSILKFGEYLHHGAVTVCSDVGAYSDIPDDAVVKIEDDWGASVEHAFAQRDKIYKRALAWWTDNYSWTAQSHKWLKAYLEM